MAVEAEMDVKKKAKKVSTVIADYLTERIEKGDILPGERMLQMELAEKFKVSRIGIRDSLQTLKQRGLVVDSETKGVIIRPLSIESIEEIFIARSLIEGYLLEEFCSVCTEADMQYLQTLAEKMKRIDLVRNYDRYIEMDKDFHSYIFGKSGRKYMIEILNLIWLRFRQARSIVKKDTGWLKSWLSQACDNHQQLLIAIKSDKPESAGKLLRKIILESGNKLIAELKRQGWAVQDPR